MPAGAISGRLVRIVAAVLVVVVVSGLVMTWMEKRRIEKELRTTQQALDTSEELRQQVEVALDTKEREVAQLSEEKQKLSADLEQVRLNLARSDEDLAMAKEKLAALETYNLNLAKDVAMLNQAKAALESQVAEITRERQRLEERLHSLAELRKAIREVKTEEHQKKVEQLEAEDQKALEEGNRGYLVFQQQSTLGSRVKIQVLPATPVVQP